MRSVRITSRIIGAKPLHDVVARHREGADAAGAVAGDAVVDQQRRDLLRSKRSSRPAARVFATFTAQPFAATFGVFTGCAGQHGIERTGEQRVAGFSCVSSGPRYATFQPFGSITSTSPARAAAATR